MIKSDPNIFISIILGRQGCRLNKLSTATKLWRHWRHLIKTMSNTTTSPNEDSAFFLIFIEIQCWVIISGFYPQKHDDDPFPRLIEWIEGHFGRTFVTICNLVSTLYCHSSLKAKALQKAEYSDFCILTKFETQNILYIWNISRKNWIFIFLKYSQTWANDHLWIATTCLQRHYFLVPFSLFIA